MTASVRANFVIPFGVKIGELLRGIFRREFAAGLARKPMQVANHAIRIANIPQQFRGHAALLSFARSKRVARWLSVAPA
jgi:hypothetical protein